MESYELPAEEAAARAAVDGPPKSQAGMMRYNEGDHYDGIGRRIDELILKTEAFIVFLDEFGSVQWGFSHVDVDPDSYDRVSNRVAELEIRSYFLRHGKLSRWMSSWPFRKRQTEVKSGRETNKSLFAARRLIAEGIARLLSTNSLPAAEGILDTAEKWITQRSIEYSRRWLLVPFGLLSAGCLIAFFGLMIRWESLPESGSPKLWFLGALLGGIGALVSYVSFNRQIPFDATAGRFLHTMEAMLRWFVGVVAGLTIQMLIEAKVLFGFLVADGQQPSVGVLAFSLLAGLSELFFPSLLKQFDQGLDWKKQGGPSPTGQKTPESDGSGSGSS